VFPADTPDVVIEMVTSTANYYAEHLRSKTTLPLDMQNAFWANTQSEERLEALESVIGLKLPARRGVCAPASTCLRACVIWL
jgi:hypothetical protein